MDLGHKETNWKALDGDKLLFWYKKVSHNYYYSFWITIQAYSGARLVQ